MKLRYGIFGAIIVTVGACSDEAALNSTQQVPDAESGTEVASEVVPIRAKMGATILITQPGLTVWLSDGRKCRAPELADASWSEGIYSVNLTGNCSGITGVLTVTQASNEAMAALVGAPEPEFDLQITMPDGRTFNL